MIRLYTPQRFAHFSPQDSIASVDFSHYMVFEKRMTETQPFGNINSLLRVDHTKPTNPLPTDLPLQELHVTYSTMLEPIIACGCTRKFLAWIISVPFEPRWRSIGRSHGYSRISKKNTSNTGFPRCPNKQSTQMCIKVATLSWTIK